MKTIQLIQHTDQQTNRRYWDTTPIEKPARRLPIAFRTTHTLVGNWKVDQQTGRAALVRDSVLDYL